MSIDIDDALKYMYRCDHCGIVRNPYVDGDWSYIHAHTNICSGFMHSVWELPQRRLV